MKVLFGKIDALEKKNSEQEHHTFPFINSEAMEITQTIYPLVMGIILLVLQKIWGNTPPVNEQVAYNAVHQLDDFPLP